jgi:hypothetical protein
MVFHCRIERAVLEGALWTQAMAIQPSRWVICFKEQADAEKFRAFSGEWFDPDKAKKAKKARAKK